MTKDLNTQIPKEALNQNDEGLNGGGRVGWFSGFGHSGFFGYLGPWVFRYFFCLGISRKEGELVGIDEGSCED